MDLSREERLGAGEQAVGRQARRIAYLDHAATSPIRPEVLDAMMPWLTDGYGNPSGTHAVSRAARKALDDARDTIAEVLGGEPGEIVFTSGGTEADNLAVTGAAMAATERGATAVRVACSAVEHPAVLEPVRRVGGTVLPVGGDGLLDLERFREWLSSDPVNVLEVSLMLVNNETGAVQPFGAVARQVREEAPDALLHTDAVQAVSWLDVAAVAAPADLVTVSAHKFGGPKGVGALLVRESARRRLRPLLVGGPQEHELRAGTPGVAAIVGMAEAARLASLERESDIERTAALADMLVTGVLSQVDDAGTAVSPSVRIGAICNMWFGGVQAEELLFLLDESGVCASAGSACASGALEPSHVLVAMGREEAFARSHVRFSLGHTTTAEDISQAVDGVSGAVARLRTSPADSWGLGA